jgi:hypothetical protein
MATHTTTAPVDDSQQRAQKLFLVSRQAVEGKDVISVKLADLDDDKYNVIKLEDSSGNTFVLGLRAMRRGKKEIDVLNVKEKKIGMQLDEYMDREFRIGKDANLGIMKSGAITKIRVYWDVDWSMLNMTYK